MPPVEKRTGCMPAWTPPAKSGTGSVSVWTHPAESGIRDMSFRTLFVETSPLGHPLRRQGPEPNPPGPSLLKDQQAGKHWIGWLSGTGLRMDVVQEAVVRDRRLRLILLVWRQLSCRDVTWVKVVVASQKLSRGCPPVPHCLFPVRAQTQLIKQKQNYS